MNKDEMARELADYQKLLDKQKGYARIYSDPEIMTLCYYREKYPKFEDNYYRRLN